MPERASQLRLEMDTHLSASQVRGDARSSQQLLPTATLVDTESSAVVAPGQSTIISLQLDFPTDTAAALRCPLSVRLTLSAILVPSLTSVDVQTLEKEVLLRNMQCRAPEESAVCTFTDVDGAVTPVAVVAPLGHRTDCDPALGCPVIL